MERSLRDVSDLIRQNLLDEFHGNIPTAFEDACRRLALDWLRIDELEAEVAQWRKGASLAFLRRKAEPTSGPVDDVPNPITDCWITTGKEA
jgi:hypothetical protein